MKKAVLREAGEEGFLCEVLLALAVLFLFLFDLGDGYLWQDEAQTALIARTILKGGLPLGHDGLNSFSQEWGADMGAGAVWRWHPWLPFYVVAPFLAVQSSAVAARLPFALFGAATVALAYRFVREAWTRRRPALIAALLLASMVPFLLLSRQCKYYSMAAFFSLLALYGYRRLVARERGGAALTAAALIALFHTHYVYCVPLGLSLMAHAFVYHRPALGRLARVLAAFGLVSLPWAFWYGGILSGGLREPVHATGESLRFGAEFLRQVFRNAFPAVALLPASWLWWTAWRRTGRWNPLHPATEENLVLLASFVASCLGLLALTSPDPHFRYMAPLLPPLAILLMLTVEGVWARSRVLGAAFLVLVLPWGSLSRYGYELTHDFRGPMEGIVGYLRDNAKPTDVVAITYGDMPLKFYTPLRVVGGLTGEDLRPAATAQWVIPRKYVMNEGALRVARYLDQNVPWYKYEPIPLDAPDTAWQNREDPEWHRYATVVDEDPVMIFKRVTP
jgi:4-amino-4-deoxy-L-arabinose transferase-like glycosyltransferase